MAYAPTYIGTPTFTNYGAPTYVASAPVIAPTYIPAAPTYIAVPATSPTYTVPKAAVAPTYTAPTYTATAPTYLVSPTYVAPTYTAPTYTAPTYTAPTYLNSAVAATVAKTYGQKGPQNYIPTAVAVSGGAWNGLVDGEEDGQLHPGHVRMQHGHRRTKALVIGINYNGSKQELKEPTKNARRIAAICEQLGYTVRLMIDGSNTTVPTRANIIEGLRWLATNVHPGDMLFFYFAGHGWKPFGVTGNDPSLHDEAILPLDWYTSGPVLDDILHGLIVDTLPQGSKLTAVFDTQGAAGLDLPYSLGTGAGWTPNSGFGSWNVGQNHIPELKFQKKVAKLRSREVGAVFNKQAVSPIVQRVNHKRNLIRADVVVFRPSESQGPSSMTTGFINSIYRGHQGQQSYLQVLTFLRDFLSQTGQTPEVCLSKPYDLNHPFEV